MSALPRIAVVLDFGSASPLSILASARDLAEVVFLCDRSRPYVRERFDDIAALARVEDITGLPDEELPGVVERLAPDGLTTFSESQLNRAAALADPRRLPYLSPATARALTDKYTQRKVLAAAGLGHAACRIVRDPADLASALAEVGLPAIIKPRSGAASARTCRIDTARQAPARLREVLAGEPAEHGEFVVESLLTGDPSVAGAGWGDYVSVESVTCHGTVRHVEVTGKFPLAPPFRETGYVVPGTLGAATRRKVLELAGAAIAALDVRHGVTHIEVKLTPDGPRIIELNGRVGGYVSDLIRRARGFDLVRAALLAALGRDCDVPPASYRRHAFQYFLTPPMDAVGLTRLDGVEDLLRRPGIQAVEIFKRPGDGIDWRAGTLAYLGIVYGSARDHEGVRRLVAAVEQTLKIEYVIPLRGPGAARQ